MDPNPGGPKICKSGESGSGTLLQVLYFGMFSRDVDDKIIYALNLSTPTASIQARGANSTGKQKQLFRFHFSYVFHFVPSVADSFFVKYGSGSWILILRLVSQIITPLSESSTLN
jgi:hypothetical protein